MKETEAKTKWCPLAQISSRLDNNAGNRYIDGTPQPGSFCMGASCMMWKPNIASERINNEPHGDCGLKSS